ncbi:MAG: glycosyltransferase [Alphaproteobacteria bacterium]|nr:glycosyltransferase [Alphaproteobacteria bacterium]
MQSLLGQSVDSPALELAIILVDNTPGGELAGMIPLYAASAKVHYIHEPKPGIPFARNAALRAAVQRGANYIAFVDDDEIAPRRWIQSLHAQIEKSGADVIQGGLRRVTTLDDAMAGAESYISARGKLRQRRTAATNNVLFKAWLVTGTLSLKFDEALAKVGGSDTEFFMRAHDRGAKIVRATHPAVFEVWSADRDASEYTLKRAWRCGASTHYRYRKNRHPAIAATVLFTRASWRAVGGIAGCLKGVAIYPFSKPSGAKAFRKAISSLGFAAGCLTPYASIKPETYY